MFNELLVLGQVPGTNIQITFNELLMLLDISFMLLVIRKYLPGLNQIRRMYYMASLYIFFKRNQRIKLSL